MSPWETFWIIPAPPSKFRCCFYDVVWYQTDHWPMGVRLGRRHCSSDYRRCATIFFCICFAFFFDYKVDVHLVFQFPTSCYELCVDFFGTLSVRREKKSLLIRWRVEAFRLSRTGTHLHLLFLLAARSDLTARNHLKKSPILPASALKEHQSLSEWWASTFSFSLFLNGLLGND